MAPGCGFTGIGESGASLASPYVAAAVWLRFVLDQAEHRQGFIPKTFWRDVLAATRPIPGLQHPVESGGLFDAPMLVAPPPGRHYILRLDGTVVPIENLKISYSCRGPNGPVKQPAIESLAAEAQREAGALTIYANENGRLSLWLRLAPAQTLGRGRSEKGCEVQAFEMTADSATGPLRYDFSNLKTLADTVAFVAW